MKLVFAQDCALCMGHANSGALLRSNIKTRVSAKLIKSIFQKWQVFVIGLFPLPALANTGPMPAELGLLLLSLFVVIPGVTLIAIARILISWRKGLLDGVWVVAIMAAAAFGTIWLLAHTCDLGPSPLLNWLYVYFPLAPVVGIWIASTWNKKREI